MTTPLQQLKANIYQSLPDLMELGVGCEFNSKYYGKITATKITNYGNGVYSIYGFDEKEGLPRDNYYPRDLEILGRPITLPDVLRWMSGLEIFKNRVGRRGNLGYIDERAELLEMWNYLKYTIDDQSDQLIEFLFNLKKE